MIKNKLFSLIFMMCFLINTFSSISYASEYIKNFQKVYSYQTGQFTDVGNDWFSESVQSVYEIGLMQGNNDNTFNPNGNLSNAEAITIASRLHCIYQTGEENFMSNASVWYQPYLDYAVENGICDNNFAPNLTADRAFFVGILGNASNGISFEQKNNIADGQLYDVNGWYSNSAYLFYRAGILGGNDEYGTFAPDKPITRAEVAAILVRIVKPTARINVNLKERPLEGTYSITEDDGSLSAYKERALVANFKVLLENKEKDENWVTDTYTIHYPERSGEPANTIVIPKKYLDVRYEDEWNTTINFKASHVDSGLSNEVSMPIIVIKTKSTWTIGGKTYYPSVINTNGKVDFSYGWYINGDLQLYYPGTNDVAARDEIYTYNSYTQEAQNMIAAAKAKYVPQRLNSNDINNWVSKNFSVNNLNIKIGQLTDWKNNWYITSNDNDMYMPLPRQAENKAQKEYIFTCENNSSLTDWCRKHFGEYVVAVVSNSYSTNTPIMLSAVSGYKATVDEASIQSWNYINGSLTLMYKPETVEYVDTLKIYDDTQLLDKIDVTGLIPVKEVNTYPHPHNKGDPYYIEYKDSLTDYSNKHFYMNVNDDEIIVYSASKDNVITFKAASDKAVIGGKIEETLGWMGNLYENINTEAGKTVTVSPKPKIVDGTVYLPPEFIVKNLFNQDINNEEIDIKDLSKLIRGSSDWNSYLEGYPDKKFKLARNTHDGYEYTLTRSYDGPYLHFNIGSTEALYIKKYGYNDNYKDEGTVVKIKAPQKVYEELYLPADTVIDTLFQ